MALLTRPRLVLLDRDGVLSQGLEGYIRSPDQLEIFPDSLRAVARLNQAGIWVALVSNQSGVGRGLMTEEDLHRVHQALVDSMGQYGAHLDLALYAMDSPDKATPRRKPGPGMLQEAMEKFSVASSDTIMVGDDIRDAEAAAAAGCGFILVLSGHGEKTRTEYAERFKNQRVDKTLSHAVDFLLSLPQKR